MLCRRSWTSVPWSQRLHDNYLLLKVKTAFGRNGWPWPFENFLNYWVQLPRSDLPTKFRAYQSDPAAKFGSHPVFIMWQSAIKSSSLGGLPWQANFATTSYLNNNFWLTIFDHSPAVWVVKRYGHDPVSAQISRGWFYQQKSMLLAHWVSYFL